MASKKKIAVEYIQKEMGKELKTFHYKKNQLNAKEDSNAGNDEYSYVAWMKQTK